MFNAKLYKENNDTQKKISMEALENYGNKIKWKKGNNRIIDIGCGDGIVNEMLKSFLPRDIKMLGCDINESMVKLANDIYRDEKTSFMVLDIEGDIPKKMKRKFTHAFSFFTLHWITDQERAFRNIYRLLEQDGQCFLVIVGKFSTYEVYRSLALDRKWNTWMCDAEKYISPYHDSQEPEKEITEMMTGIGFDNITVKYEDVFNTFVNIEALKEFLRAIFPFKIPEDKYDDFWTQHMELWKQYEGLQNKSNDYFQNNIKYKFKVLIVYAHKPKGKRNWLNL